MYYIGIDPGVSGGLALINDGDSVTTWKMPRTARYTVGLLRTLAAYYPRPVVVLERVWAGPYMGRATAFAFGVNVGMIRTALAAAGLAYTEVTPQTWQREMGILSPKGAAVKHGTKDKNVGKRAAQAMFPRIAVTHAIADAMLIAAFARRVSRGEQTYSAGRKRNGKKGTTIDQGQGAAALDAGGEERAPGAGQQSLAGTRRRAVHEARRVV